MAERNINRIFAANAAAASSRRLQSMGARRHEDRSGDSHDRDTTLLSPHSRLSCELRTYCGLKSAATRLSRIRGRTRGLVHFEETP